MGQVINLTFGRHRQGRSLPKPRRCIDCDDPIETARLQAIPEALRCISCQRGWERNIQRALEGARDRDVVIIRGR